MKHWISRCVWGGLALLATAAVQAKQVELKATLATPVVKAGKAQTAYLKVAVTGLPLPTQGVRAPANLALVIDRSGSMSGDRIVKARQAAMLAVESLTAEDIVAVVAFDSTVEVVTPATKVADKAAIIRAIEQIQPRGSTALFAGVAKGAQEVRKFLDKSRVNRVILLSDGQANVGPSTPGDLGQLGATLSREGISVTTIGLGLGYNEDLMTQLAGFSDGNHAFVANADDLARIFKLEFGDVAATVAQELDITIRLGSQIRPLKLLGRDGEINGQVVRTRLSQLGSEQEKFLLLEVEVPAGKAGEQLKVAAVEVNYLNLQTKAREGVSGGVSLSYSESAEKVAGATDKKTLSSAVQQLTNQVNKEALQLRDQGRADEAKQKLEKNADFLKEQAQSLDAPVLRDMERDARQNAANIDKGGDWNVQRKGMKEQQYKVEKQQKY